MPKGALEKTLSEMMLRFARLEGAFEQTNERLGAIERRLDGFEARVEQRFAAVDQRFAEIDQRFNWVIGTIVGTWITTILAVLLHR